MKKTGILFAFILSFIFVSLASAQITAIKAGKLVDPETGTTAINQVILIENGKIKC